MAFETELKETCPFCKKGTVIIMEKPAYRKFQTSRGSGVSNTYQVNVKGDFRVASGCSECGKTREEIKQKIYGDT
ncbi:hypothetical protein HY995_01560 [Candidatus Micrarchaeota archaeon]|nr:hypothetical protein [Candidatus Micrarchaeota archaeon]